jgi:hypothetical protein
MIAKHIESDRVDPGGQLRIPPVTSQAPIGLEKGFLKEVLAQMKIAGKTKEQVENGVLVLV